MRAIKNTITEYPIEATETIQASEKQYNIALEINIWSKSPVEAARKLQDWIRDRGISWHFYVQDDATTDIYSIDLDLDEDDDHMVIEVEHYSPVIKPRK